MNLTVYIIGKIIDTTACEKLGKTSRIMVEQIGEIFCLGVITNDQALYRFCWDQYWDQDAPKSDIALSKERLGEIIKYLRYMGQESIGLPIIQGALRWLEAASDNESRTIRYQW